MNNLSDEQRAVVNAPLQPMSVIACAGSGKTLTAVYRIIEISRRLARQRGRVAMLSFSNVAVDTFQAALRRSSDPVMDFDRGRIEISTVDGFLTTNVLRPHASRIMECDRVPFCITGGETFRSKDGFKFWSISSGGKRRPVNPDEIGNVVVSLDQGVPVYGVRIYGAVVPLENGGKVTAKLGRVGAYTHELGRYWCFRVLMEQPKILLALAHRYPQIIVDEAQDLGSFHQKVLLLLSGAGSQVTLIGDPYQSIYEFAGADGGFLRDYCNQPGVATYRLTRNYRSVSAIREISDRLSCQNGTSSRKESPGFSGSYFVGYDNSEEQLQRIVKSFRDKVVEVGMDLEQSAVLCRGSDLVKKIVGGSDRIGQGLVARFAQAAVSRDRCGDYRYAFDCVVSCIVELISDPPVDFVESINRPRLNEEYKQLKRKLWRFTKDSSVGLPLAELNALTEWHPLLKGRVIKFLQLLQVEHGFEPVLNIGNRLSRKSVPDTALIAGGDGAKGQLFPVRIDTVHQVKGESLDAVLYMATGAHVSEMLNGVSTENGRIGYVAITRAKDLFWLGVPRDRLEKLRRRLLDHGFVEFDAS